MRDAQRSREVLELQAEVSKLRSDLAKMRQDFLVEKSKTVFKGDSFLQKYLLDLFRKELDATSERNEEFPDAVVMSQKTWDDLVAGIRAITYCDRTNPWKPEAPFSGEMMGCSVVLSPSAPDGRFFFFNRNK